MRRLDSDRPGSYIINSKREFVRNLDERELATIEKLDELGIDAVIITKYPDHYRMDFTYIGDDSGDGEEE